ncbi:malate dehydrogenase [Ophiocordyceps camponoti-floridani]|uniref:Malate dehydrogenase n=1 Tax=Ophiocordyceps camponoti-floridani TaxID=2030778 RepID=A0A8H4QDT8_9HYPO|nr:malate dehydrogenase [Ophiocordyceps camponoti-floridani]
MMSSPLFTLVLTVLAHTAPGHGATTGQQLPSPPAGVSLKHIALGFGYQNYTCKHVRQPAVATGALAMLYDVTTLYPGQGPTSLSHPDFENLTAKVLSHNHIPIQVHGRHSQDQQPVDACIVDSAAAYASRPFPPDAGLWVEGIPQALPFLGHHYFDADGVPVFRIDGGRTDIPTAKVASVQPPAAAYAGPDGTGAVPWLFLRGKHSAVGVKYVYRVVTAGGTSHGCARATGDDSSSYAALYWFYG